MPVDRRIERQLRKLEKRAAQTSRKQPLSVERIVQTALDIVAAEGFEALTMRRVAATLDTGPASLYAHVVNKADLDELLIGYLCSRIVLPEPDPQTWREQIFDLAAQIRDQYLRYPGISQAALGVVPSNPEALRLSEGMLGHPAGRRRARADRGVGDRRAQPLRQRVLPRDRAVGAADGHRRRVGGHPRRR